MKPKLLLTIISLSLVFISLGIRPHAALTAPPDEADVVPVTLQNFGQMPLYFIENQGQVDERVAYYLQGKDKSLYFTADGITIVLPESGRTEESRTHTQIGEPSLDLETVHLDFVGANPNVRPLGRQAHETVVSYFKGAPESWQASIPTYAEIIYPDLWPGIDLIYSGTDNELKYEFIVNPGADPDQIQLAYRGVTDILMNKAEQLAEHPLQGNLFGGVPVAYQNVDGQNIPVSLDSNLTPKSANGSYQHEFQTGTYNAKHALIIDPGIIVYSGFIGGGHWEIGRDIVLDDQGNAYIVGWTGSSSETFPVVGGLDLTINGNTDAFVAKVNPDGTGLIFASYIGGSEADIGNGIAIDSANNVYITGSTESSDFPTPNNSVLHAGANDAFVAKINSIGTSLEYGLYIGSVVDPSSNEFGKDISVDTDGHAYVVGTSDDGQAGGKDAFVTKISIDGSGFEYITTIGGSSDEQGNRLMLDSANNVYVTGSTESNDISDFDGSYSGGTDAFVARLNASGSRVDGLYYGGTPDERGAGINGNITVNTSGDPVGGILYFVGISSSGPHGGNDVFIVKLNPQTLDIETDETFGGSGHESTVSMALDDDQNVYVTGITNSSDIAIFEPFGTSFSGGDFDSYVAKLGNDGFWKYGYYLGGGSEEQSIAIAVDSQGNAYMTGWAKPGTWPTKAGPDLTHNGGLDAFVMKIKAEPEEPNRLVYDTIDIPTGDRPGAVSVNSETNYIYIVNSNDNTVTVLNGSDQSTITVPVGIAPIAIAVNPVTNKIYVANQGPDAGEDSSITVINGADNTTTSITVGEFMEPNYLAVNSVTNKIYVTDVLNDQVIVIDGTDNSTIQIPINTSMFYAFEDIAINQRTNRIYVTSYDSFNDNGVINVIDGNTDTLITEVLTESPDFIRIIKVNSGTNKIYVGNGHGVTVMDGGNNTILETIDIGSRVQAIAIDTTLNEVYITSEGTSGILTVINSLNDTVKQTILVDAEPDSFRHIAVNPTTNQVFVNILDLVKVYNARHNFTVDTYDLGESTSRLAVNPKTDQAFATHWAADKISILYPKNLQTGPLDVGVIPGPNGCQNGLEAIWIKTDDEHDDNENSSSGWVGAITQDRDTSYRFCRVDGAKFKHWAANNDSHPDGAYGYAVLKLGETCPNGSKEFSRYFDNQNTRRWTNLSGTHVKHNENAWQGNIYPNTADKDTTLYFCFFGGQVGSSNDTMDEFPAYQFEYGVFAHSNFLGATATGHLHIDDEDDSPDNRLTFSPSVAAVEQQSILQIISGVDNTGINLAQVHVPPDERDFIKCPDTGFCEDNPRPIDLDISVYRTVPTGDQRDYEIILEHFANAIFEMTEGVQIIRNVTIYQDSRNALSANVRWIEKQHPKAHPSGYHQDQQVQFGDEFWTFDDEGNPDKFIRGHLTETIIAGYTLGHEWGHYFYGLPDEYEGKNECDLDDKPHYGSPCKGDIPVPNSVMNSQSKAIGGNYEWLNFSVKSTDTIVNALHRVYEASGWETLARNVNQDPPAYYLAPRGEYCDGRVILGECFGTKIVDRREMPGPARRFRVFFPELAEFDFGETLTPTIQLDTQTAPAINVEWDENKPGKLLLVLSGGATENGQSPHHVPVTIDSSPEKVELKINFDGTTDSGNVTLIARKPDGQIADLIICPATGTPGNICTLEINQPENGEWTLEVEVENPPLAIEHVVTAIYPEANGPSYHASVKSVFGNPISYPIPIILTAEVAKDLPIAKVGISAQANGPDGTVIPLSLKDDGVPPDKIANDGEYVGFLPYDQDGTYQITVAFDNKSGTAEFSSEGYSHPQPSYAVDEDFQRVASSVITVVDYQIDDHGNTPNDATPLTPDNNDLPGQIDNADDVDIFKVVPEQSGKLVIRVAGLAFGMEPKIRILAADGVTVLAEMLFDPNSTDYMHTTLDVIQDVPFYVEVTNLSDTDIGLYFLSVGSPLTDEEASDNSSPETDGNIYLPVIMK